MSSIVGGINMSLPIILGAGVAKHPSQAVPYLDPDAPLGAVVSGSYTLSWRGGNQGDLMWPTDYSSFTQHGFGLNAWGMPNIGLLEATAQLPEQTKPHTVSCAGFSADEYVNMLTLLKGNKSIAGFEGNLGCPNTGHLPVAYVLEDMEALLKKARKVAFDKPIWWKLSPYMTRREREQFATAYPNLNFDNTPVVAVGFIEQVCDLLMDYSDVASAIVMSNTVPNVAYGTTITVHGADGSVHHRGGLSGSILRPHNLDLIRRMVNTGITAKMDIIGCGGVETGNDALEYFNIGCSGVACTSGPAWSDVKFFQKLIESSDGLQEYLSSRDDTL
jgi:dihydroorotate dehydrogenase (NAD+) catalytic subunit